MGFMINEDCVPLQCNLVVKRGDDLQILESGTTLGNGK